MAWLVILGMLWYIRVRGIILAYLYTPGYTIDRYQNEKLTNELEKEV